MDYQRIAPMMGLLWSPIAAVTSTWQGRASAQIAVAVGAASIVPDRPRMVVQIYKSNFTHEVIAQSRALAINFLREDQLDLIKAFGFVSGRDRDKLAHVPYRAKVTGSPVLDDCWGFLDCRVVNAMDGGDMTCFLAEVLAGEMVSDGSPLWWREARRRLPSEWMAEWDRKISAEIKESRQLMDLIDYTPWESRQVSDE